MAKKVSMGTTVRINAYTIIQNAVANGVACGYHRAFKHTDAPTEVQMVTEIENYVMNELCDVLDFGDCCKCEK